VKDLGIDIALESRLFTAKDKASAH